MKSVREAMCLYAVTDRAWVKNKTLYEQVEQALKGGVTCVQLREKELDDETFLKEGIQIKELCKHYHIPFIINDNVEVAIRINADGVHIGQDDQDCQQVRKVMGSGKIIGVSCQTVEQALKAQNDGADYLGVGAVFSTNTKNDAIDVDHQTLKAICETVHIPVVAIGGINKENILQLKGTQVDGVALVSAIFAALEIREECQELLSLSKKMVHHD